MDLFRGVFSLPTLIDKHIPQHYQNNVEALRISRILIVSNYALILIASIYSLFFFLLHNLPTALTLGASAVALAVAIPLFKYRGNYTWMSVLLEVLVFICPFIAYITSGNISYPGSIWLMFAAILAGMVGSKYRAMLWLLLALITVTLVRILSIVYEIRFVDFAITDNMQLVNFMEWLHVVGFMLAVFVAVVVFENSRRLAAETEKSTFEKLLATKDQLIQSEKLSAIGQMVAGVAHEVNTPRATIDHLITIAGKHINKILQTDTLPQAQGHAQAIKDQVLSPMESSITRIGELTEGLLNFTRKDHKEMKPSNLHQIIDSVLVILRSQMNKSIEIHKSYGGIPGVVCYPGQMNQVFMNMLTNSMQAMKEGVGHIWIRTWSDGDRVCISIKDDGIGMSEETKKKMFDPFYTTKEVGKGTGLGMSIVWDILQKHNAMVDVDSNVGVGTEMKIVFQNRSKKSYAAE